MKYLIQGLVALFILASCQSEELGVKDLSEILPSSERDYSMESNEELANAEDSSNYFRQVFLANGILIDNLWRLDSDAFPDRFNPKKSDRFKLQLESDTVTYECWIYSDSSGLLNAYFNWLDCFGNSCTSVKPGDKIAIGKSPMQLFVNDTTMILVSGDQDMNRWFKYHTTIGFDMNWRYVMEQSRFGKMNWYRYEDGERMPLEPITANK